MASEKDGVQHRNVHEDHDGAGNEDDRPAQDVFHEVPEHDPLIEGFALPQSQHGKPVDDNAQNGNGQHAPGIDRFRLENPGYYIDQDED